MIIEHLEHNGVVYRNFDTESKDHVIPDDVLEKAKTAEILEIRRAAYAQESDALYMEWQYDQTPEKEQAWRDKVAEIKARYPLPSES